MKHGILVFAGILLVLFATDQLGASSPYLSIATNPVNYGQNDKITASVSAPFHDVQIYINNKLVAGPQQTSVNYTVCGEGICLVPGTYAVTAKDTNGSSTTQNLVVLAVRPTFTVQASNTAYGQTDKITASPAFENDTTEIRIDQQQVIQGHDVVTYDICGISNNQACLVPGVHNISVEDTTEGVWSSPNQTVTVTPVAPSLGIAHTNVQYGNLDMITGTAPVKTDSIAILLNNSQLKGGTGTATYTICNSTQQGCIKPGTYTVKVQDTTERVNSSTYTLTITPQSTQLTLQIPQVTYGTPDRITAKAPNKNDSIELYIDNNIVARNTSSISYMICSPITKTACLSTGKHSIYVYDVTEDYYSSNVTIDISPAQPSIFVASTDPVYGFSDAINGTAPYYNDSLDVLINGNIVAHGNGTVGYVICSKMQGSCLPIGSYKVVIQDASEGVNSIVQTVMVLPAKNSGNATSVPETSMPTTTIQSNATQQNTTSIVYTTTTIAPSQGAGSGSNDTLYIDIAAIIVVGAAIAYIYTRGKGGGNRIRPPKSVPQAPPHPAPPAPAGPMPAAPKQDPGLPQKPQ